MFDFGICSVVEQPPILYRTMDGFHRGCRYIVTLTSGEEAMFPAQFPDQEPVWT